MLALRFPKCRGRAALGISTRCNSETSKAANVLDFRALHEQPLHCHRQCAQQLRAALRHRCVPCSTAPRERARSGLPAGQPRAAARAKTSLVVAIGGASHCPTRTCCARRHWTGLWTRPPQPRENGTTSSAGRARRSALATARALDGARIVDPCAGRGDVALPLSWGRTCCCACRQGHSRAAERAKGPYK